jgi:hypothetical protein
MNGPFPRYAARTGPFRVVAANLPAEHARALRAYCARENVPIQAVLKALVADWLKINGAINAQDKPQQAAAAPRSVPMVPLPVMQETRQNTGRNEPVQVLQKIDATRNAAKKTGRTFTD